METFWQEEGGSGHFPFSSLESYFFPFAGDTQCFQNFQSDWNRRNKIYAGFIFISQFFPQSIIIKVTQFHCKEIAEVKKKIMRKLKIILWGSLWKDELNLGLLANYVNILL